MDQCELIRRVNALLDEAATVGKPDEITLRHCLNEGWFSDELAWLLDPQGNHGFGVRFLQEFMKAVARERCRPDRSYARRASHLRWSGAPGAGRHVTGKTRLHLGNAASFREFYLARGVAQKGAGDRYCDVVVLDLDRTDGVVLVIENKLFGTNSRGQLRDQTEAIEEKYHRATVREYVYLTLFGEAPTSRIDDEVPLLPRWVALSWMPVIIDILDQLEPDPSGRLRDLVALLRWLRGLSEASGRNPESVMLLVTSLLNGGVECLLEELNRFSRNGRWLRSSQGSKLLTILHSSAPARRLKVKLITNCSIAIQSTKHGKARCDKLLLPFGAPAGQIYNLINITARDLYWIHFDKPKAYLKDLRRRKSLSQTEKHFRPLLDLVWRRRYELQALMGVARCVKGNPFLVQPEEVDPPTTDETEVAEL